MNWNGSQLLKQTKYAKHKGVTEAYISAWIKRDEVSLIKWKLDLRSMEWANRFSLGGFTVSYSSFQMAWEVIEKTEDEDRTEISHRWFKNRETAERWCEERLAD